MKAQEEIPITKGSGNIFADIGCKNPKDLQIKAELARQIYRRIKALHLTQMDIAQRLNLQQPEVSRLANARSTGFSTDRLIGILNALQVNVDIVLSPQIGKKRNQPGLVRVLEHAA